MAEIQLVRLLSLIPICLEYTEDGVAKTMLVFMDFVGERNFDRNGDPIEGTVGDQLMAILKQKKGEALPVVPPAVAEASKAQQQGVEAVNDVRKQQAEYEVVAPRPGAEEEVPATGDAGTGVEVDRNA